jgi:hypothetical protein
VDERLTHTVILRPEGAAGAVGEGPAEEQAGEGPPEEQAGGYSILRALRPAWRRAWGVWGLLAALAGLLAGWLVFQQHRDAWVGHNGDHYYYASTALQYAGAGYERSLQEAADYFRYADDAVKLDFGYLDPAVAPLIYPRVVLGLLAVPAIHAYGVAGVWFGGLLCGALAVLAVLVVAGRRAGRVAVVAIPVLIGVTRYAPEFMFGIYQEAPVIAATALLLAALPLGAARRTPWHALAAAGLVPVVLLSRQVPLLPAGMVVFGWLWAWIGSRRLRNAWLPFVLAVLPVTGITYLVLAWWAPYDALPFLFARTGTSTVEELIGRVPAMWSASLQTDWNLVLGTDRPLLVVTALGLAGFVLAIRNPVAGVFLGSLLSGVATELLNGQPNGFRYLSPSLPPLLLLGGFAVACGARLLLRTAAGGAARAGARLPGRWRPDGEWPPSALLRPQPRPLPGVVHALPDGRLQIVRPQPPGRTPQSRGGLAAALTAWLAVAGLVWGAVAVHPRSVIASAPREHVSAATFPGRPWPFAVPDGTLVCAGDDYQMWFIAPDGTRYALSGTAMAASLRTPRVLSLAPVRPAYSWPEIKPLLTRGLQLCGAGRGFQQRPR